MKILAAHQPAFMPWLGYLDRIAQADRFVILGGVQFEKNSFTNRNQILLDGEPRWLTVPLKMKGHTSKPISAMEINHLVPWRRKHLETIRHAYRGCPDFDEKHRKITMLYQNKFGVKNFMELAAANLVFWLSECGLAWKIPNIEFDHQPSVKTGELIALCKKHDCDVYLSGPFGRDYLEMERFVEAGIEVRFHEPDYPPISVIDTWMKSDLSLLWRHTPTTKPLDAAELSSSM